MDEITMPLSLSININVTNNAFGLTSQKMKEYLAEKLGLFFEQMPESIQGFFGGKTVNIEISEAGKFSTDGLIIKAPLAEIKGSSEEDMRKVLVESIVFEMFNIYSFNEHIELDNDFYEGKYILHIYGQLKAKIEMNSSYYLVKAIQQMVDYTASSFGTIHITKLANKKLEDYLTVFINTSHKSDATDYLNLSSWKVYAFEGAGRLMQQAARIDSYFTIQPVRTSNLREWNKEEKKFTTRTKQEILEIKKFGAFIYVLPDFNDLTTSKDPAILASHYYSLSEALKELSSGEIPKLKVSHNGNFITDWTEHTLTTDMIPFLSVNLENLKKGYIEGISKKL